MPTGLTPAAFVTTLVLLGALVLVPDRRASDGLEAARVAAAWAGAAETDPPRREGDEWEIDVARPDGSLVEVTIGDRLELLGLDEEMGPGGGYAEDEVTGSQRLRAVRAALAAVPGGRAVGVERESNGEVEVAIRRSGQARVEVGLDRRLRLSEVEPEHIQDE